MKNNDNKTVNFDWLRRNQTDPCDKATIAHHRALLGKLPVVLEEGEGKKYYMTIVIINDQKAMKVWHKREACRVCLYSDFAKKHFDCFGVDLNERAVINRKYEYVLTISEIIDALKTITGTKDIPKKSAISNFKDLTRWLLEAYGPSGREKTISEVIASAIRPYVDEMRTDAMGNLICLKRGTSGKKVMLSAHMDQIGLMVLDIDEKGFLRFAPVGGIDPEATLYRDVVFQNGVRGVIYCEEKDVKGVPPLAKMFIDIGARSREEAEAHVSLGDICVYAPHFIDMGSRIACGALDDRLCCAIVVEAMKEMASPHDIYAVFTVQEEVGLRGAYAAAYSVEPDLGINLDVTAAADTPECDKMPMEMGKGPTVKYYDRSMVTTKPVIDFMHAVAEKHGLRTQNEILRYGGTDAGAVQSSRGGRAACCVSIATRYIHSAIELADIEDCLEAVKFVRALAGEEELPEY